jgi:hypothetical protein
MAEKKDPKAEEKAAAPSLTVAVVAPKTVKLVAPKDTCSVGVEIGGQWVEVAVPEGGAVEVDHAIAAELVAKHGFEAA